MARVILSLLLVLLTSLSVTAQGSSDPVVQALAQGDLYQSKRKYELALDAYHKADKLSHHSSAASYLKLSLVERKLGDFSSALDDAKRALKVAGDNKTAALQARLVRSRPGQPRAIEAAPAGPALALAAQDVGCAGLQCRTKGLRETDTCAGATLGCTG